MSLAYFKLLTHVSITDLHARKFFNLFRDEYLVNTLYGKKVRVKVHIRDEPLFRSSQCCEVHFHNELLLFVPSSFLIIPMQVIAIHTDCFGCGISTF